MAIKHDLKQHYAVGKQVLDNLTQNCNKVGTVQAVTTRTVTVKHRGFKVKHTFKKIDADTINRIIESLRIV